MSAANEPDVPGVDAAAGDVPPATVLDELNVAFGGAPPPLPPPPAGPTAPAPARAGAGRAGGTQRTRRDITVDHRREPGPRADEAFRASVST